MYDLYPWKYDYICIGPKYEVSSWRCVIETYRARILIYFGIAIIPQMLMIIITGNEFTKDVVIIRIL